MNLLKFFIVFYDHVKMVFTRIEDKPFNSIFIKV